MSKPRITCYRSHGELWWTCEDEFGCYGCARTPIDAWDAWFNRTIPF